MPDPATTPTLTPALEDYLETIYQLVAQAGFARVRDIATARDVRPASVTPAMKRLDEMGLIDYERREYVGLTAAGEVAARRIYSRHQVLARFFTTILGLPSDIAEHDACAAEHSLSPETIDQLVRLFEYMEVCPQGGDYLQHFQTCSAVHDDVTPCPHDCEVQQLTVKRPSTMSLAGLQPGQRGRVVQVESKGAVRQRLLDMGLIPDTHLEVARTGTAGDPVWIRLQGYELALRRSEAQAVMVEPEVENE